MPSCSPSRVFSVWCSENYGAGGPRSVWEENPEDVKTLGVNWRGNSVEITRDEMGVATTTTALVRSPGAQQSIGQSEDDARLWRTEPSGCASDSVASLP